MVINLGGGGGSSYKGPSKRTHEIKDLFRSAAEEVAEASIRLGFASFDENDFNLVFELCKELNEHPFRLTIDSCYKNLTRIDRKMCSERISESCFVICFIGEKTSQNDHVIWELDTAIDYEKIVIGISLYPEKDCIIPSLLIQHDVKILIWHPAQISKLLKERGI